MKLLSIRIEDPEGHVLHVFDKESRPKVWEAARRAIRAGHVVRWENGVREWREVREQVDTSKEGSAQYQWDAAGEMVRADILRCTQWKDGRITKVVIGSRFVRME